MICKYISKILKSDFITFYNKNHVFKDTSLYRDINIYIATQSVCRYYLKYLSQRSNSKRFIFRHQEKNDSTIDGDNCKKIKPKTVFKGIYKILLKIFRALFH